MKKWFNNWKLSQRLAIIALSASLPMVAITLQLILTAVNKDINFSRAEKLGNRYLRPLEALLEAVTQHRVLAGTGQDPAALAAKQTEIDQAFASLLSVDREIGTLLQFTPAGLAQRKRDHVLVENVQKEWTSLRSAVTGLSAVECEERHAHLITDLRTMITHAGDTSNLILDPDLDSYYLMDITLIALPQTQDRLSAVHAFAEPALRRKSVTPAERTQLAVHAALLQEADLDRINTDAQTALSEDANFHGVSESFQRRLPGALQEYNEAMARLLTVLRKAAADDQGATDPATFARAAATAQNASFQLWRVSVDELDVLLDRRVQFYTRARTRSLIYTGLALLGSGIVVFLVGRGLKRTLGDISRLLLDNAGHLIGAASQLTGASRSLATLATEQASSLEETSASLSEMSGITNGNAESAQRVKNLAGEARKAADTGTADLQAMREAMNDIKSASNGIARILKTIDEIAFQTNILALNASVEAARAGESGLGFAVVANEVRNLAQRCADAARETAKGIADSIEKSERGVQISTRVANNLTDIAARTRQVDELMAQIACASKEQHQTVSQITSAVVQLEQVTQSNVANADQTAGASIKLHGHAGSLNSAVEQLGRLVGAQIVADTTAGVSAINRSAAKSASATNRTQPAFADTKPKPVDVTSLVTSLRSGAAVTPDA